MGLAFRPIKAEQLAAASGGTDFSELFVYFSFFLIVAAALLVAMLFRLGIEQRARQLGLMAAVGFAPGRLRRLALEEGLVLAFIGAALGLVLAVGYTWLIVYGLRTRWVGAVGTTSLRLYVRPETLLTGFFASLLIAALAVLWGVWRVAKLAPSRLLAGAFTIEKPAVSRTGRVTRGIGIVLAVLGLLVLALVLVRVIHESETALAGGALLLCGGLTWLAGWLRPRRHAAGEGVGLSSVAALGVRNASRHTARSVLSVGLIAFAAFTLITVASMQRQRAGRHRRPHLRLRRLPADRPGRRPDPSRPQYRRRPRAGRVPRAECPAPLPDDVPPPAPLGRAGHQLPQPHPADQPDDPRRPPRLMDANPPKDHRFTFADSVKKAENPWTLLDSAYDPSHPEVVPVITDAETAEFILHLSLGKSMAITDQTGAPRQLRLVATLSHSIFQSEMLMSESNFRRLFPTQAGFGTILVDVPADQVRPVEQLLNNELDPYAPSIDTTAGRLATYKTIINTYLDTFRVLGSLGLALGSIGLAVVLIRNVIERRPELALLSALGFRPNDRVKLVLSENAFLLVLGLVVGTACALLGVTPTVINSKGGIAWGPLGLTLLGVLVLGFVASAIAVWLSGIRTAPADLRRE